MKKNYEIVRDGRKVALTDSEELECFDFVLEKTISQNVSAYVRDLELTKIKATEIETLTKVLKNQVYNTIETVLPNLEKN